ncbi:hypothetical protein [Sphingopyxis sp.]|jgi:hypothetical protein
MTPERDDMDPEVRYVLLFVGGGCLFAALALVGVIWGIAGAVRWAFS